MTRRASAVGELVLRRLSRSKAATVTRVFPNSAYLEAGTDYFLVLRGRLRSPMTVNISGGEGGPEVFAAGSSLALDPVGIGSGAGRIEVGGADVFRSPLLGVRSARLPPAEDLAKGVSTLKSLYDVSPHRPTLPGDRALNSFALEVLVPFVSGRKAKVYRPDSYFGLIGRGGGFTPAGDDFVSGFAAAFNHFARAGGKRGIRLPRSAVASRTIPESAAIVVNSSLGQVDEGLGSLILATSRGPGRFFDELVETARRGHTSGLDMSLGVMLAEAALSGEGALKQCLRELAG